MRIIYLGIGILLNVCAFSQKHDYNYVEMGSVITTDPGILLSYDEVKDSLYCDTYNWDGNAVFSATINDASGEFIGFSNGLGMWNSSGDMIENGDSLAVGFYLNFRLQYYDEAQGYGCAQNLMHIPVSDSLYYIFQLSMEEWQGAPDWAVDHIEENYVSLFSYSEGLWLTKVRINNEGKLYILENEKKVQLLDDILGFNQMTFVKKDNGEDWWLLLPEVEGDSCHYYSVQVESGSVVYEGKQYFSPDNGRVCNTPHTAVNERGDRIVRMYGNCLNNGLMNKVELFEFDRCSGQANRLWIDSFPEIEFCSYISEAEFSNNGKFLYLALGGEVYQCDLEEDFPIQERVKVAELDSFRDHTLPNYMDQMWKLPNGKILLGGLTSDSYYHYIHKPDERGDACEFEIRAFRTPPLPRHPTAHIPTVSLPVFPPYRMPPLRL